MAGVLTLPGAMRSWGESSPVRRSGSRKRRCKAWRDGGSGDARKMGRITGKLSGYWHEVTFAWRATRTWADQCALLLQTIQFHIRNGLGCACDIRSTVTIDLWIDHE